MASFKKSIVIPLVTYKKLSSSVNLKQKNEEEKKEDINIILERQKQMLAQRMYNVQPYNILSTNQNISKKNNIIPASTIGKQTTKKEGIPFHEIISHIRQAQVPYIKEILNKMLELDYTWNERGEITIEGQLIRNSNVINIMKFFSNASIKEEPIGTEELWVNLSNHIPKSWFLNKPNKAKKKTKPYSVQSYPLENKMMENKYNISKNSLSATDDEFSENSTDDESMSLRKESPIFKKSFSRKDLSYHDDTDHLSADEEPDTEEKDKIEEARGGIIKSSPEKISPPVYQKPLSDYIDMEKQLNETLVPNISQQKPSTSRISTPQKSKKEEDIFGKIKTGKRKHDSVKKTTTLRGRTIKRNPKYHGPEWEGNLTS